MCTFEQIKKANESIKTTDIKGKEYAEVNQRIKAFRMVHPNGLLTCEIVSLQDGVVLMKASAFDENGKLLGTGFAQEKENSTFINKTSFIENAETSAWGRCLGSLGFGVDTSVASYEEVSNAMQNQDQPKKSQPKSQPKKEVEQPLDINQRNITEVEYKQLKDKFGVVALGRYLKQKGISKGSDLSYDDYLFLLNKESLDSEFYG